MTPTELEKRLTAVEQELADLKSASGAKNRWWDKIAGAFADNPRFEKTMSIGRNWRERPHVKTRQAKKRAPTRRKAAK